MFSAVGSGKTSACLHPFARQLLSWQAHDPERRPAALILEVKSDFCHDIRAILKDAGCEADYIELSLDGRITWNPLSATWLDSYSLAYTVASLLNQLFGKGKEPYAARAAQVAEAATEAATANRHAAEAWDALATQAATHAGECRHGAELADRTRRRWAR